jgi:molybdenum cofactor cytidylyltransferase
MMVCAPTRTPANARFKTVRRRHSRRLDLDGQPLLRHLVETILQATQIERIIVITGHEPQRIRDSLTNLHVEFVHNPDHGPGGMLSSVKVGAAAIKTRAYDGWFVMLLDQPLVRTQTLNAMMQTFVERNRPAIIAPAHHGKRGHPILIAGRCAETILALPASATLRDFVVEQEQQAGQSQVVEVDDPGVLTALDTPADYQHILNMWRTAHVRP